MPDNASTFKTELFVVRARQTKWKDDAKYGIMVTKRTLRLATDRNRAKRLLRAWIKDNEKYMLPDMDYVFSARREILNAIYTTAKDQMKSAIKKVSSSRIADNKASTQT